MQPHRPVRPVPPPAPLVRRCALVVLFALAAASLMGLLAWGPVQLTQHTHAYADARGWAGLPHAANVLSHVPLIPLGLWGLWRVSRLPVAEPLRGVWALFFGCQILATLGGMAYHLAPSDARYVWDQLPKSAACTFLACAFLAECIDARWAAPRALLLAGGAALGGGAWWLATFQSSGQGDLRPLLWLEYMPTLLVATGAWQLSGRLLTRLDWQRSLLSFVVAQSVDWLDAGIFDATGWIAGHAVRHLALASCVAWLAWRLGRVGQASRASSPRLDRAEVSAARAQASARSLPVSCLTSPAESRVVNP